MDQRTSTCHQTYCDLHTFVNNAAKGTESSHNYHNYCKRWFRSRASEFLQFKQINSCATIYLLKKFNALVVIFLNSLIFFLFNKFSHIFLQIIACTYCHDVFFQKYILFSNLNNMKLFLHSAFSSFEKCLS